MIIQFAPTETHFMTRIKVEARTEPASSETIPCQDLRKVGLESASERLSANRGDLGEVIEARAKADIFYCPVCPEPHVA